MEGGERKWEAKVSQASFTPLVRVLAPCYLRLEGGGVGGDEGGGIEREGGEGRGGGTGGLTSAISIALAPAPLFTLKPD